MWRKSVCPCVPVLSCDNPRIVAIKIMLDNQSVLVFRKFTHFTEC